MPNIDLGIAKASFELNYPTIDGEIEIEIPHHIPKLGGKKIKLDDFSVSATNPSITLPVSYDEIGGSVTVGLDFTKCEVQISGEVKLDVVVKKFRWKVGPVSVPYMDPLLLTEPSWSVNPENIDLSTLQPLVNNGAQSQNTGASTKNDDATKADLTALFLFAGAGSLITDLLQAAADFTSNLSADVQARPDHPLAESVLKSGSGGAVLAFGISGTGAGGIGGNGACGAYFTTDGDWGWYGSAAIDLGFIAELSVSACGIVYWPDAGQTALDCFKGNNFFVATDAGELLCGSLTVSWPEDASLNIISKAPCGIAVGLGIGGGYPVNFFTGNSRTWTDLNPPNFNIGSGGDH